MAQDRKPPLPQLDWRDGAPASTAFDDVYFSGDGAAETQHVFLAGNHLPARWREADRFCIGELGFGTGLNFLVTADAFARAQKPAGATLHFFSVEGFPLGAEAMAKAHEAWPQFAELSGKLRRALPPRHAGFHQCWVTDDVCLTLYYGNALDGLAQAEANVDAWFFDGFSPAKNPDMWSAEVFAECARLSATKATFATFTVAGSVRRALTSAGFSWDKREGFGRKREMLAGAIAASQRKSMRAPWHPASAPLSSGARVAIIGAGIAGANLAHALQRYGATVTVFERESPAAGASGNPAGLIMPRLDADETPAATFFASAYLYALSILADFGANIFNPCGVLLHESDAKAGERFAKLVDMRALPETHLERNSEGLFFPQGGVADPRALVRALLSDTTLRIEMVNRINRDGAGWRLETDKSADCFDGVIIANARDALRFSQSRTLPLNGSAGQIDWFASAPAPAVAHAFGPYAAPCPRGGLIIGATYAPIAISAEPAFSAEATGSNISAIAAKLPALVDGLDPKGSTPRASVRCTTPDRLPVAGPVPDWGFYSGAYDGLRTGRKDDYPQGALLSGLYVLTGLGSRGLVTAPLCAAIIAAEMAGTPSPVSADVAQALHPARFFIRDLKRANRP